MNIDLIKQQLIIRYPSFGGLIASKNFELNKDMDTAGTDGSTIYYNDDYLSTLTSKEKQFIIAHEISHIALKHLERSREKNIPIWNKATDAVINARLIKDGLPMPEGLVYIEGAENYSSEEMYEKLLKENKDEENKESKESKNGKGKGNGSQPGNSNGKTKEGKSTGNNSHEMWKKALEETKSDNESTNSDKKQINEDDFFDKLHNERKKQLENLKKELQDKQNGAGRGDGKTNRNINSVGRAPVLVDWRKILKQATKYDVDWSYQNASIENGVLTPFLERYMIPETEILLDVSASVSDELVRNFLRECKNILKTSKVKVGFFDKSFYGFTELKNEADIENLEILGGGGTNFDTAVNAFSRRAENKIIFTDGDADMPKKEMNVIWLVYGNKRINPKGGKVINIDEQQIQTLMNKNFLQDQRKRGKIKVK